MNEFLSFSFQCLSRDRFSSICSPCAAKQPSRTASHFHWLSPFRLPVDPHLYPRVLFLTCAEILSTTGKRLRGDPLDDWPFAAAMIQPARRPDVFGFGHQLHSVCSMRQLSRPADLMIAAWACRHSSLLAASFLACTIPPDLPHILGSSGGSSRRTPDPDRIASLRQRARGDTMSVSTAAGNTATGDTSNVPVTAARAFSTQGQ